MSTAILDKTELETPAFEALAQAARKWILHRCMEDGFGQFAADARVSEDLLNQIKNDTTGDFITNKVSGKDWERMLAAGRIDPEDWYVTALQEAREGETKKEKPKSTSEFLAGHGGLKPSELLDQKISRMSTWTNKFFFEATTRFLKSASNK